MFQAIRVAVLVWVGVGCGVVSPGVPVEPANDAGIAGDPTGVDAASPTPDGPTTPVADGPTSALLDCAQVAAPAGYARAVSPVRFTQITTLQNPNATMLDFPLSGSPLGLLRVSRGQYAAIEFAAPASLAAYQGIGREFEWDEAQVGGAANVFTTYISVSHCPGDFRIPTTDIAPANDPTFRSGCRNLVLPGVPSAARIIIPYEVEPGTMASTCPIEPGGTYYFNMILANPDGGIQPGEHTCKNSLETCGIQLQLH